jgi:OTU domain-containing protein 6
MAMTREELEALHRKQTRDLTNTITGLKKQATKKTRKAVNVRCAEMEQELKQKQAQELRDFEGIEGETDAPGEDADLQELIRLTELHSVEPQEEEQEPRQENPQGKAPVPRKNRQKERLARRAAKEQELRDQALEELKNQPDLRAEELAKMDQKIGLLGLEVFDIKPDGHCLFASIQHQLQTRYNVEFSIDELRQKSAAFIRENADDFVPFLMAENREVDEYTQELETTAMWGSDMEILALSRLLDLRTTVVQADSTVTINEDGTKPIFLGYFRHSYGLGEHYNSLQAR